MPKLVFYYMRPVAVLLLFMLSIAILSSYIFIPKSLVFALPDFYHHYWRLLSVLLLICILFLGLAFYAERKTVARGLFHLIALALIAGFIWETLKLIDVGGILFAFID